MKKEFNVIRFLYICWSIAIVCNIAVYSCTKEINSLVFLIVFSVCLAALIIIDIISSNSKIYVVIVENTFLISKNHYNRDSHILTGHNLRIVKFLVIEQ